MADRWTCKHEDSHHWCGKEHKTIKAALECSVRIERHWKGDDSEHWTTVPIQKGFYNEKRDLRTGT